MSRHALRYLPILSLGLFIFPVFAHAALININTADVATLDTLPHVGLTTAQKIIDYRTANGPFMKIEDLQKVKGIGSGSNYADIAPLITVGDTGSGPATATSTSQDSSTSSSSTPSYVPPPSTLTVKASSDPNAILEVPLHFSASVKTKSGATDSAARMTWSFGDGSVGEGTVVEKTYHYAGTYLITVTATDGTTSAEDELTIVVKPAAVRIESISGDGITIANDAHDRLDLSGWRLSAGTGFFRIPEGTILLPKAGVLFPSSITNLPVALDDTSLAYPDGVIAARYVPPIATTSAQATIAVQPPVPAFSSSLVQTVESPVVNTVKPIISANTSTQAHEEEVRAPATTTELAAAGAALASSQVDAASPASGIFHSPWTLGFLSIMVLAGGAFILL